MSHQEERKGSHEAEAARSRAGQFSEAGKATDDDIAAAHSEFLDRLQEVNRRWTERMRLEAELGAEVATQLASSRSFADTTNAIQHWTSKHLDMASEDARRVLSDSQKILEAGARVFMSAGRGFRPSEGRGLMS